MKNLILIVSVVLGLLSTACVNAAEAEYYTWVDENGVTNYAERNPEGVNATFVSRNRSFGPRTIEDRGRPGNVASNTQTNRASNNAGRAASNGASQNASQNGPDPDALVDEEASRLAAEMAEIKRKNCEIGKNNLAQIKAFARLRVTDENGQSRILTDEEKEARAETARQTIRENCSGG